ncbi:MAG: hypothetical protein WC565_03275 [Parcubacteria group bacterium]|jgi:hypothetical protein
MAQAKTASKEKQTPTSTGGGKESPIKMATEAKRLMDETPMSIPPDLTEIAMQQISDARVKSALNMAKAQELETKRDLEQQQNGGKQIIAPTLWGAPAPLASSQNPILGMIDMLPEADRKEFIKENKETLFGSLSSGVTGSQLLNRMANTGGDKPTSMGDLAQLVMAMAASQAEQQKSMLNMWMSLQQMSAPPKQDNGNKEIVTALMQLSQAMGEGNRQREALLQDKLMQMQADAMERERQHNEERLDMIQQMFERQMQQAQAAASNRSDLLTKGDLVGMLQQIKDVTGVELKPDQNVEAQREQHEHMQRMKELEMQEKAYQRDQDAAIAAKQAEAQKWAAVGTMLSPIISATRMKKQVSGGASKTANNIRKRAIS